MLDLLVEERFASSIVPISAPLPLAELHHHAVVKDELGDEDAVGVVDGLNLGQDIR